MLMNTILIEVSKISRKTIRIQVRKSLNIVEEGGFDKKKRVI